MKKKVLAVLLASAMVASLASGCGNKASETTGTTTTESAGTTETASAAAVSEEAAGESEGITFPLAETKNFSMLCIINGDTPMDEVDAFKHLNEQSNIIFDVNSIPQEDASEKKGLSFPQEITRMSLFSRVLRKTILTSTEPRVCLFHWRIISEPMRPILQACWMKESCGLT